MSKVNAKFIPTNVESIWTGNTQANVAYTTGHVTAGHFYRVTVSATAFSTSFEMTGTVYIGSTSENTGFNTMLVFSTTNSQYVVVYIIPTDGYIRARMTVVNGTTVNKFSEAVWIKKIERVRYGG